VKIITLYPLGLLLIVLSIGCKEKSTGHKPPNILFAISDDQSFAHTSFIGSKFVKTPAFDKVAREGVYFSNCFAGSPGCAPSRSSFVTGRYHWQNEQSGQHASSWLKKYIPFIDLLDNNGYITGRTGKGVAPFQYARDEKDSLWRITNAGGVAHNEIKYEKGSDNDVIRGDMLDYAVEIEWFDLHLQRMLEYLEETGELENTIVIATSDNGMPFPRAKANCFEYGVHVPLAIRFPKNFPGGRIVEDPVSFIDLAPTILELTKINPKGMLPISGRSILNILKSKKQNYEFVLFPK
jgi:uncharacterized sulfatase